MEVSSPEPLEHIAHFSTIKDRNNLIYLCIPQRVWHKQILNNYVKELNKRKVILDPACKSMYFVIL